MDLSERDATSHERHPWELARLQFFRDLLEQQGVLGTRRWLDVGAGDAWFATKLRRSLANGSTVICWDPYYTPEDLAESPQPSRGVSLTTERPTGTFGGILMLDVIEHVEDDVAFLKDIVDTFVAPSGWVLVSVPAYQCLFTDHDRRLRHFRRYSPRQCRRVLESAGLTIDTQGGLFHSLLLPRAVSALLERMRRAQSEPTGVRVGSWRGGSVLTSVITAIFHVEDRLSLLLAKQRRVVVPGLSYWAFCRKAEH